MFTVATTIGYGEFAPITDGGRVFTMFMAFATIGAFINALGQYTSVYSHYFHKGSQWLVDKTLQVAGRRASPFSQSATLVRSAQNMRP